MLLSRLLRGSTQGFHHQSPHDRPSPSASYIPPLPPNKPIRSKIFHPPHQRSDHFQEE
ncbi:hypothetical protein HZS_7989 [Henneguya salminicola]|nr:hypothetical protein HZS_7989 [Henneguya salminicola]